MCKVIGISGKARSGKDTFGNMLHKLLKRKGYKVKTVAFADPIKKAASIMFDIDIDDMYNDNKDKVNEFWGISPRKILQLLGTECGRDIFFDDIWVKRAFKGKEHYDFLIITDTRFDNEAVSICEVGGEVMNITSDRVPKDEVLSHVSENGISGEYINLHINNNGSIQDLENEVKLYIEHII